MKKAIILLFTSLLIVGCSEDKENGPDLSSIDLLTSDSPDFFEKTVILFEDENYLIKTNLDTYLNAYPFGVLEGDQEYDTYEEIKQQVIEDSNDTDILIIADYFDRPSTYEYILAHHLQDGSCLLYDKKDNKIIETVQMEGFAEGEPMTSTLGRRFYIKGSLFLEVVDAIS